MDTQTPAQPTSHDKGFSAVSPGSRPSNLPMKKIAMIVGAVILLLVLLGGGYYFFWQNGNNTTTGTPSGSPLPSATTSGRSMVLPLAADYPGLINVGATYVFEATLQSSQQGQDGLVLQTNISGGPTPPFVVTPRTAVSYYNNGVRTPTSVSNLQPGQTLYVSDYYSFLTNTWSTIGVDIIQSTTPSQSTSSATAQ